METIKEVSMDEYRAQERTPETIRTGAMQRTADATEEMVALLKETLRVQRDEVLFWREKAVGLEKEVDRLRSAVEGRKKE